MKMLAGFCALALSALACTEVTRTSAAPQPPLPDELPGRYAAEWTPGSGSAPLNSFARIEADTIGFEGYPCFSLSGQEELGGIYEYDLGGHFHVEAKTLDGSTKLVVDGTFSGDGSLSADYTTRFLDELCQSGTLALRPVQ